MTEGIRSISIVLFDGFELLDVFGPAELFGMHRERLETIYLAPGRDSVRSAQGVTVVPDFGYSDAPVPDLVLVPGGRGTRSLVDDSEFLVWLRSWAAPARLVTSVCTGAALLAAAGLLDGYRATSNKRSFAWVATHGADVEWVPSARWVEDRDRWTSSGVAAGMDMAAALLDAVLGDGAGRDAADRAELELHTDPGWDPFARLNGLV